MDQVIELDTAQLKKEVKRGQMTNTQNVDLEQKLNKGKKGGIKGKNIMLKKTLLKINQSKKITIFTSFEDIEETFHGYIVGISNEFICLWNVEDWHHNGFKIIPIEIINDTRCNKYEETYHEILMTENVLVDVSMPKWLDITSIESIFKSFAKENKIIGVEGKYSDEIVIGEILCIENNSVTLKGFDACARWLDGSFKVPYDELLEIYFDDEYTKIMYKYINKKES